MNSEKIGGGEGTSNYAELLSGINQERGEKTIEAIEADKTRRRQELEQVVLNAGYSVEELRDLLSGGSLEKPAAESFSEPKRNIEKGDTELKEKKPVLPVLESTEAESILLTPESVDSVETKPISPVLESVEPVEVGPIPAVVAPENIEPEIVEEEDPNTKAEEIRNLQETIKKSNKKGAFSLKKALAAVIAAVAIVAVAIGCGKDKSTEFPTHMPVETEASVGEEGEAIGIVDGYDKAGMWLSDSKGGEYDFANAAEVGEANHNNPVEMIKYTARNQVESFADYMASLPESVQPEKFKGKSLSETEAILESLSDEEYRAIFKDFCRTMDGAQVETIKLEDGEYDNALMRMKDKNGDVVHNNMELVHCATHESGLEATRFTFLDDAGNVAGDMTVKMTPIRNENGDIVGYEKCEQVIEKKGSEKSNQKFAGLEEVTENPQINPGGTGSEPGIEPEQSDAKTPFTREQVEEGGTGTMTQREQDGRVTTIDEDRAAGSNRKENNSPNSASQKANNGYVVNRVSEEEKSAQAQAEAARAAQEAANAASVANDQRASEIVQSVEQNGGATQAQMEQKNQEQANAWNNGDFNLGE